MKPILKLTRQALLIWLSTNAIASLMYALYMFTTRSFEPLSEITSSDTLIAVIVLGLAFSFPVILFLVPGLYVLGMLRHTRDKVAYALGIILVLCLGVIVFFFMFFDVPDRDKPGILLFLLPYIIAAEISFFVVARKVIIRNLTAMTQASTGEPQKI